MAIFFTRKQKGKLMKKKWKQKNDDEIRNTNELERCRQIDKKFDTGMIVATILNDMHFKDDKEIEKFLKPKRTDFYNPFFMPDMEKSIEK